MSRCAPLALAVVACACGNSAPNAPTKPPRGTASPWDTAAGSAASSGAAGSGMASDGPCHALPFAESTPVPEASGAAWLTLDGKPALLVISDSGNHGAYGILDATTGATLETGALPLTADTSDDLEGVAARGDRFYGLTSSGWIYVWKRAGAGFERVGTPYPLAPLDDRGGAKDAGMACAGRGVNCGRNYEGLCLVPASARPAPGVAACVGFAAAKADGALYCLTDEAGKLVVHRDRAIAVTRPEALADCAFADDGTLWAASNLFDLGNAYRITGWADPAHAQVDKVAALAIGFPETIAARGDIVYRMSDLGGAPSLLARYRCTTPH